MTDNKKLIEATQILQKNCKHKFSPVGCNCIFARGRYCTLEGAHYYPKDWAVPKPRRFTDADIEAAKKYDKMGGRWVIRFRNKLLMQSVNEDGMKFVFELPQNVFKSLNENELITFRDIIKEGGQ